MPSAICLCRGCRCSAAMKARSGHAMNNRVLRALMADATAWEVADFVEAAAPAYAAERGLAALQAD